MPKIHFGAEWSIPMTAEVTERLARRERPEGVILLRVDRAYLDQVRESFSRLHGAQVSRADGPLPLEVTVEYGAAKRSLDANRLMWALYGFMAEVQNAGHQGTGMVTKEDLYRADMQQFADVYQLICHERDLESLRGLGWAWRSAVPLLEQPGKMLVDMIVTSSKWDSLRFHKHLQLMFNRLAEMEPPPGGRHELLREWVAWRQELNDQRIQLVTAADQGEYRAANPVCEGCGRFVGHGGERSTISRAGAAGPRTLRPGRPRLTGCTCATNATRPSPPLAGGSRGSWSGSRTTGTRLRRRSTGRSPPRSGTTGSRQGSRTTKEDGDGETEWADAEG